MTPDYLIVGAGTAGCVLASRLSEDPDVTVRLIEAGADIREAEFPPEIAASYPGKAYFNPRFTWPGTMASLGGTLNPHGERVRMRYEQARVLGGGSSINGLLANRGAPTDYDAWEALGATGWNRDTVQPYFRKLERDLDFDNEYHGKDGPIAIRRYPRSEWTRFAECLARAAEEKGFAFHPDQSAEWRDGLFAASCSVNEIETRESCGVRYLSPEVRRRPNLQIVTGRMAAQLLFEGRRAIGVEALAPGHSTERHYGRRVIVSCGAIFSPALLMRSGIGGAPALSALGIPIVADRAGVGANLQEHPVVSLSCYLRPDSRVTKLGRHHTPAHLRFSSGLEGTPSGDMNIAVIARSAWHALGLRLGSLLVWVNRSYSKGTVSLASADPAVPPDIDFRMLSDPRDRERLRKGFRFVAELATSPTMDACRTEVFPTSYSDRVRKVSSPGALNGLRMSVLGTVLDVLSPVRGVIIEQLITNGVRLDELLADDDVLDAYVDRAVTGAWHAVGSCRLGRAEDPLAVTAADGAVIGVGGLSVCDASLMPTIPCANTNIPTIMVAERVADLLKSSATEAA